MMDIVPSILFNLIIEIFTQPITLLSLFYIFTNTFLSVRLQNEKTQLHTHRSTMLRLNASVHSWLTRQEMKAQKLAAEQSAFETVATKVTTITADSGDLSTAAVDTIITSNASTKSTISATDINTQYDSTFVDQELHDQLKNEVGEMYCVWDEADQR